MQVEDLRFVSHQWLEFSFRSLVRVPAAQMKRYVFSYVTTAGGGGERGMTKVAK